MTGCDVGLVDLLPDEVLLAIFDLYVGQGETEAWQTLGHVCRRWRNLVFGSPRGLNLQLICTLRTPARETLDVWPPFPLVISASWHYANYRTENVDNLFAVLEHRNRVCQIHISIISISGLEKVLSAMQETFPELKSLILQPEEKTLSVLPDSFLGGSSPQLRTLHFRGIPFPGLPRLLLSATHLTDLCLEKIPHLGYFSPEEIATALSASTSLEDLHIGFESPLSLPDRATRRPPPPTRLVLPALKNFMFKGVEEYLEDLVVRIDAPLLNELRITFFNQILFDTPRLVQFISRTSALKTPEKARVFFWNDVALIKLWASDNGELSVKILCKNLDWQVSSLEQVCTSCLPPLSALEDLRIFEDSYPRPDWQDNIENSLWLELLRPFIAVKNLYLSKEFAPRIVPFLREQVGERTTEVLPTLQNIFLERLEMSGPVQEGIEEFVARRQASHHITVSHWNRFRD